MGWGELKRGEKAAGVRSERDAALAAINVANARSLEALEKIKQIEAQLDNLTPAA